MATKLEKDDNDDKAAKTKKQAELIQKVLNDALEATGMHLLEETADSQSGNEEETQSDNNDQQTPLKDVLGGGTVLPGSKSVSRISEKETESVDGSQQKETVVKVCA